MAHIRRSNDPEGRSKGNKRVYRIRREAWDRQALPGMLTVPTSFTFLPTFKLQKEFVNYDKTSIDSNQAVWSFYSQAAGKKVVYKRFRLLYPTESPRTRSPPPLHPPNVADLGRKSRKLLRQQRTLQTGIHLCVKDPWVVTDDEADFQKKIEDPAVPVPYLPNSTKTDGMQVKVFLSALEPTKKNSMANAPLPRHIRTSSEPVFYATRNLQC